MTLFGAYCRALPSSNLGTKLLFFPAILVVFTLALIDGMCPNAKAQAMQYPISVAVDRDGTAYVADRNLPGIWKVKEGKAAVFFKGSKQFRTPLNAIRCVAIDPAGKVLAGDSATRDIYRFEDPSRPVPLTNGKIGIPMAMALDSRGDIYVADLETERIYKVPSTGGAPVEFAVVPSPRGLAIDSSDSLWVVSHGKDQLVKISQEKNIEVMVQGKPFQFPHNVVLAADNTAYVVDGYAKGVWKVAQGTKPDWLVGGEPLSNPVGLALSGDILTIADPVAKNLFTLPVQGGALTKAVVQ